MNWSRCNFRQWKLHFILGVLLCKISQALTIAPLHPSPSVNDGAVAPEEHQGSRQPNIIFILTDDQDLHMSSLDYMPHLQSNLVREGTFYKNHYCTISLCCPSRVSLWTGKHAHNTNVTDVNPPHGGYPKFVAQGLNDAYLPLWLQDAGYDTYYVGKLFNAHNTANYDDPYPRGWNGSDFLLDPYTYEYLNATMQRNLDSGVGDAVHEAPRSYEGEYVTDVIADKSFAFLDEAITQRYDKGGSGRPFFLTIAPTAPHSNFHIEMDTYDSRGEYPFEKLVQSPPIPAKRHEHLFPGVVVPRTPDFNPEQNNTVSWLKDLPQQNQTVIDSNDNFYRQRLRALQAVDEIIPKIIMKLEFHGIIQETYVVYTTDNGYHIGQHRLQPGKQCAYETDINVPMIVRGPDVVKGRVEDKVSSHVDIASTFLSLAGVDQSISRPKYRMDGQQMVFHAFALAEDSIDDTKLNQLEASNARKSPGQNQHPLQAPQKSAFQARDIGQRTEHVNVETWGVAYPEGEYGGSVLHQNHTYKALRVISPDDAYNLLYVVWCTNEHELYDLTLDPYALHNLLGPESGNLAERFIDFVNWRNGDTEDRRSVSVQNVVSRLDALMMVLKTCKGRECTNPWEELHCMHGGVESLLDAVAREHDEFYDGRQIDKVEFQRCEMAYIPEAEGATWSGRGGMWQIGMT